MGASLEVSEAMPLPERIGQYTILCQLDQGGMATLFLGRAAGLGGFERLFAIKLIHEHLSREKRFVDMFLDEARLAARIVHPNVVSVYEVGIDRGRHFIAMDYINGETLSLALQHTWGQQGSFPTDLGVYLIGQAAEGLHAAHELKGTDGKPLGVVHRDVAPSNLMLGYDGILRVMDFGVAKARDQVTHTRPGTIKGTLAYMAPEHVRSRNLDRRADVWSLGVVLWETLVGKRLFKGRNDVETSERLLRRRILAPSQIRPQLAPELDEIVLRALQRDPNLRFATAREFGEALQEYLATARLRIGPSDVEAFMKATFEERFSWRQEIQQRAPTATAKEFRVFEGLIEDPASDSELEIDLLAEDAMEEIIDEPDEPVARGLAEEAPLPLAADAQAAVDESALLASPPVEGVTAGEQDDGFTESTQVIRSERALAKARNGRAEKVSDGRIFLYQWREKADQSVELMLKETKASKGQLLAGMGGFVALLVVLVVWATSGSNEPQFETMNPVAAEVTPGAVPSTPTEPIKPAPEAKAEEPVQPEPPTPPPADVPSELTGSKPIPAVPPTSPPVEELPTAFELRFELSPPSAQLTVDGEPRDPSERLSLEPGQTVVVEAHAPGYRSFRRSVRVRADQALRIELAKAEEETVKVKRPKNPRNDAKKKDRLLIIEGGDL